MDARCVMTLGEEYDQAALMWAVELCVKGA